MRVTYKNIAIFLFMVLAFCACRNSLPVENNVVLEGQKDAESGLFMDKDLMLVKGQCTGCHSAKLISMNRFTREGWKEKIAWMQQTQNLWDLGEAEPAILDYLAKYYSPEKKASRRENLENLDWYSLEP